MRSQSSPDEVRAVTRLAVACLLLGALPAGAVDGVREINQSCAAIGCWPGDAPDCR